MDFNGPELIILVALAIIIFGPEKLPELARKLARIIAYLRRIGTPAPSSATSWARSSTTSTSPT